MRACLILVVLAAGCDCGSSDDREDAGSPDGGVRIDAGPGPQDGGPGADAGAEPDAGPAPDAGPPPDTGPAPDAGPMGCTETMASDLPGVRIDFRDQRCTFTLAEAASGIAILYDVVIDAPLTSVTRRPQDAGGCDTPGPSGLITQEILSGGGERYCICDTGLCPGTETTADLAAGTYAGTFMWEGRNWDGPSDTGMPMGAPFPPGAYTLRITSVGRYMGSAYTVEATFPIRLVP